MLENNVIETNKSIHVWLIGDQKKGEGLQNRKFYGNVNHTPRHEIYNNPTTTTSNRTMHCSHIFVVMHVFIFV